jgi:hypothetical protein
MTPLLGSKSYLKFRLIQVSGCLEKNDSKQLFNGIPLYKKKSISVNNLVD